ncbi:MAG: flagellin, partial [Thermotogaceae bacterium]|nr:flagellin [Thermotogaceae bacterium]
MIISHNLSAINAHRIYQKNTRSLNNTLERLSTGLRISKAADDAAGLSISEKMRAQIKGLRQASRNAQDGISLIQTAEGGLNEINSSLIRIRELSIQAANDTLTSSDKIEIQKEIDQLTDEIDRIAHTTKFNQKTILNGSTSAHWSSDDLNTQAMIQGELVSVSSLGQINSVEGNYNINITSEETGEAEVLKSNIFEVAEIEQVTKTREVTELVEVTKTREVTGVKVEWDKVFEGYSLNASIRQTTDGGYVLLKDSGELLYQDYGIIRMDSDGTAFQGIILGGSLDEEARSIQQTTDGGFIVAGNSNSNDGIVSGNHGGYDYWIVKLNSDGTLDWEKSLGGSGDDRVSSIQQTTDGGYIVAGYSNSNDGDVSGNHGSVD